MKLLVSRFSALGDVVIAKKVLLNVLYNNKDLEIFFLTKKQFQPLFKDIDRLTIIEIDLKGKHKGFFGLKKLSKEIVEKHNFTHFADIHDVLRTKILRFFYSGKLKITKIDKGRNQKKLLIKRKNKELKQLKHTAIRYSEVFLKLGLKVDFSSDFIEKYDFKCVAEIDNFNYDKSIIGIAPFAAHFNKMYPLNLCEELISILEKKFQVIIFGGGKKELEIAKNWELKFENVKSIIGKFDLNNEIALMNKCKAMITMDSGNMHLASLTKTAIFSIWGATHPFMGFTPFGKDNFYIIQKDLFCRPCSIFGSKNCYRKTFECLQINPSETADFIIQNLANIN